jgi:predicted dithiol-disulfide oxidoreductase (DUF899 family)
MTIAFPGESAEYRAARNRLLEQEIELRRNMEAVAVARRRLPPGGVVPQGLRLSRPRPRWRRGRGAAVGVVRAG